ncbi:tryptophan-rich sensory protein [Luteolibacter yonseiensis]|uniref:Tryptophan-rich sensory protein n=1 Tax=Luteolibacter yonseiensis TaxID=1144680 RepID=A0A934R4N4_9BACT|nr:TspO/MBR family protein [Luteolibacter yonseiensis]MBK1818343.1 tryptophan-rich sensory protein [Luteolibacter yonseiensis]
MSKRVKSCGRWLLPVAGTFSCLGLGIASGLSTVGGEGGWYQALAKPPGTPPAWVFGPVWTVLYLMMGVAAGRLIHRRAWQSVAVFCIQFVLNLAWTPVFFGMQDSVIALAIIAAMWLGLFSTVLSAWKIDKVSAWLLIPYLAWVSYAGYLNTGFLWLNGR